MIENTLFMESCSIRGVCVERSVEKIDHQLGSGNRTDTVTQMHKEHNTKNQYNFISSPLLKAVLISLSKNRL